MKTGRKEKWEVYEDGENEGKKHTEGRGIREERGEKSMRYRLRGR